MSYDFVVCNFAFMRSVSLLVVEPLSQHEVRELV